MAQWVIYEFVDARGKGVIEIWIKKDRIQKPDVAQLNEKAKRLRQLGYELAIKTKLLAGPIYKDIYKLVVKGSVMLRPMLCRGPFSNNGEFTFLLGCCEVGGKLPKGAEKKASQNLEELRNAPLRRQIYGPTK
jgi:hypothetical protein